MSDSLAHATDALSGIARIGPRARRTIARNTEGTRECSVTAVSRHGVAGVDGAWVVVVARLVGVSAASLRVAAGNDAKVSNVGVARDFIILALS
jgi:hypothetical protein